MTRAQTPAACAQEDAHQRIAFLERKITTREDHIRQLVQERGSTRIVVTAEWLPIATAPTDGTVVIVFADGDFFKAAFDRRRSCWHMDFNEEAGHPGEPSHWMPRLIEPDA